MVIAPCLSFFCVVATLTADNRRAIEKELNRTYDKNVVILRGFPSGENLVYDNDGNLTAGGNEGPWTTDGSIQISKIRLTRDRIRITGDRIFLAYQPRQKSFEKFRGDKVNIDVNLTPEPANVAEASRPLLKMFLGPKEKLEDNVPLYWQPFLKGEALPAAEKIKQSGGNSQNEGNQISPPVPIHNPDPPYTQEARRAHHNGQVVLSLLVDETGFVRDVIIITPTGMGLDEEAVQTVRTWRFKPGERNGQPLKTRVVVEVAFRIR